MLASVLLAGLLASCALPPRLPAPATLAARVAPPGFRPSVCFLSDNQAYLQKHLNAVVQAVRAAAGGRAVRILALSGGGAVGSFGAGALYGLAQAGRLPVFQVVTGVSAGALIAPFAFLGRTWDPELRRAFDGTRADHLLRLRPWLTFLVRPGFYRGAPLRALVSHFVTPRMIRAVAAAAAKGRVLLVGTTDLDKEEPVIWNMGMIAAHGGPAARRLFIRVLVASASIAGIFPPVLIHVERDGRSYDEMQVDGSTTVPFFITPEIAQVTPLRLPALRRARVYVVINGQLDAFAKTVAQTPLAVLSRSYSAAVMQAARQNLALSAEFAHRYHMRLRFTFLPMTFAYDGSLDFSRANRKALFAFGEHCARTGQLWTTLAQAVAAGQRAATEAPRHSRQCPAPPAHVSP